MCFFFKRSKTTPSSKRRPGAESQFFNSVTVPEDSPKTCPAVEKLENGTGNSSVGIGEALETPYSSQDLPRWSNPQSSEKDSLHCMDSSESSASEQAIIPNAEAPCDHDSFKTPHRSRSEHIESLQKKILAARQNLGLDGGIQLDAVEVKPAVVQTVEEVSSDKDSLHCMDSPESTESEQAMVPHSEAPCDHDSFKTPHRSRSEHIASLQKKILAARQNLGIDGGIQCDAVEVKSEVKPAVVQTIEEVPVSCSCLTTLAPSITLISLIPI